METTKQKITTKELVFTALSIALITIGAYIKFSLFTIPFTLQLVMVMLVALVFGYKVGFLSTSIYTVMGLAGLPVFSSGGGLGYVANPSFGYILGFILCAFIIGLFGNKRKSQDKLSIKHAKTFAITLLGLLIVYLIGVSYWYLLGQLFIPKFKMNFLDLVYKGAIVFMPKDIFLCFIVSLIAPKLQFYVSI